MLRSMYSGVSGLKTQQIKMDTIGNNIANVNTVGFKQGEVYFQDILSQTVGNPGTGRPFQSQVGLGVSVGGIDTKFTQGALQTTGRSEDFAIQGDGMFVIAQPAIIGDPATGVINFNDANQVSDLQYTREGVFAFDSEGYLRTIDGGYVLAQDGTTITRAETTGNPAGRVEVADVIQMVTFSNYSGLTKVGDNKFTANTTTGEPIFGAPGEVVTGADGSELVIGKVASGYLEMSNVDLANEFTNMIMASRSYQANSRIITTSDELLQELVNLKR